MNFEELFQLEVNDAYETEMIDKALSKVIKICDSNLYKARRFSQLKYPQLRQAMEQIQFLLDQEGLSK